MSITHQHVTSVFDGVTKLEYTEPITGGGGVTVDTAITNPQTNQLVSFAFVKNKLLSILIESDQVLTLKTNSSGSPQETIVLVSGVAWRWINNGYFANPFAGDVTSLFVTNASGSTAKLKIRCLFTDP